MNKQSTSPAPIYPVTDAKQLRAALERERQRAEALQKSAQETVATARSTIAKSREILRRTEAAAIGTTGSRR